MCVRSVLAYRACSEALSMGVCAEDFLQDLVAVQEFLKSYKATVEDNVFDSTLQGHVASLIAKLSATGPLKPDEGTAIIKQLQGGPWSHDQ